MNEDFEKEYLTEFVPPEYRQDRFKKPNFVILDYPTNIHQADTSKTWFDKYIEEMKSLPNAINNLNMVAIHPMVEPQPQALNALPEQTLEYIELGKPQF
jgi:lysophospholipase L1-like esterase